MDNLIDSILDRDRNAGTMPTTRRAESSPRLALILVLAIAALVRLAHFAAVHDRPFFAQVGMDSAAYDRWAREIAAGDWIGSTTFYQAPLYPYFLAVVYRLFGAGYDLVYLVQIAVAILGVWALYRAGRLLGGERHGLCAAVLAALYAPFPFYDVQLVKESFAVSATSLLLFFLLAGRRVTDEIPARLSWSRAWPWWWSAGLATGVLVLLRENTFLVLPLLAMLALEPGRIRASAVRAGALVGGVVLLLLPIAIRNGVVGGTYLPTTFQGGTAFYQGNHPGASGTYEPMTPGRHLPRFDREASIRIAEEDLGRELSGAEVSSYWLGRSLTWAREEPLDFLALQARKLAMFWRFYEWPDAVDYYAVRLESPALRFAPFELGGVMLLACAGLWLRREHLPRRDLPVVLFVLGWTVSTIAFFVLSRYRMPMVPALVLFAAEPVRRLLDAAFGSSEESGESGTARSLPRAAAWSALVLLAIVLPKATMPPPNFALHHYNLGVLAMERSEPAEARRHFVESLRHDPELLLPILNLGRLAAGARDWPAAERFFREATRLEPESDDASANLGALYLATGRPTEARQWLERALELNARHPEALQNAVLLEIAAGDLETAREHLDELAAVAPDAAAVEGLRRRLDGAIRRE